MNGIEWPGMDRCADDYENGVDEPSGEFYCVICTERCDEPQPGEPPVCADEECRREVWRQQHPEDCYPQDEEPR